MNNRSQSLIKDIIRVMTSNVFSIISSIITGLIVPKMLGATNYGYYRIFVLYMTYTALLHFGFIDGIVLKDGDKNFNQLNRYEYRSNSLIFILFQFIIFLIFLFVSLILKNKIYSTLLFTIGIGTFFYNVSTYYVSITQAVMYFKRLSILNAFQGLLNVTITLLLWSIKKNFSYININYSFYIWCAIFVYFIMFIIYIVLYHSVTFGYHDSFKKGISRVIDYCKIGIYLTIAYQVSNFIMIIDNELVSLFFIASIYGKYSLSYSISNAIGSVISAVSPVLVPHLKRDTLDHMLKVYNKMISLMILVIYLCLISYFPLCILIKLILPGYIQSLSYLKVFLPELSITCPVTMIIFNYYNVLGKSRFYFYMSLLVLFISSILDLSMYEIFHTALSIAYGSLIAIIIWYMISEYFLIKWYRLKWLKNISYIILMMCSFFISSLLSNVIIGCVSYVLLYIIISISIFHGIIRRYVNAFIYRLRSL